MGGPFKVSTVAIAPPKAENEYLLFCMRHDNSLLFRTHQMWKLRAAAIGSLVSGLAFLAAAWMADFNLSGHYYLFGLYGTVIATTLVLPSSIRCPRCRVSWYWAAMKTGSEWYKTLTSQIVCPVCCYPAADRKSQ
jgi:hypothetical protein